MVDWGFGEDIDAVAPCLPGQRTGEDPVEHWKESQRLARSEEGHSARPAALAV